MTYMHDEHSPDTRDSHFMLGLITGAAIGAGVALLFAPREGARIRQDISENAQRVGRRLSENYGEVAGTVRESARRVMDQAGDLIERGRGAYQEAADEVRHGVADATRTAEDAAREASYRPASGTSGATGPGVTSPATPGDPFTRSPLS